MDKKVYFCLFKIEAEYRERAEQVAKVVLSNDIYSKLVTKDFLLNDIWNWYAIFKKHDNLNVYLMCNALIRGEIEAPLTDADFLKVVQIYSDLNKILEFQSNFFCLSLSSILVAQVNSCKNVDRLLMYADIVRKIDRIFKTMYTEAWELIEMQFGIFLFDLIDSSADSNLEFALKSLIIAQVLGLNSESAQLAVALKTIDYIKKSHNFDQMNEILKETKAYSERVSKNLNSLLQMLKINPEFELSKDVEVLTKIYPTAPFRIKFLEKNTIDFNEYIIVDPGISDLVNNIDEIRMDPDPLKMNESKKRKVKTFIYKGYLKVNNQPVAVKKIEAKEYKVLEMYQKEITLLQRMSGCPNFLKFYGAICKSTTLYIITEFIEDSMTDLINKKEGENLPELRMIKMIDDLINSFSNLETFKIYHRDIKPDNILIRDDKTPVIIDFGISEYKDIENTSNTVTNVFLVQGTVDFMSPELYREFKKADSFIGKVNSIFSQNSAAAIKINPIKSDVYSLGLTLAQFFTGFDISKNQTIEGHQKLLSKISSRIHCEKIVQILFQMLQYDSGTRPTFKQLLSMVSNNPTVQN